MKKNRKYIQKIHRKIIIFFVVVLLFPMLIFSRMNSVSAAETNEKRVLFISSFSYDWETVPLQIKGIQSVLDDSVTLNFEFMNTKVLDDDTNYRNFYESLKYRLSVVNPYDVIIVGDDEALQFVMDYRQELFRDIPVVFEGISDMDRVVAVQNDKMMTGVVEQISYRVNIDSAIKLCPKADKIVAIVDNTISGIGQQKQFFQNDMEYPRLEFSTINASEYTYNELCQKISEIGDDTILFYLTCGEDMNGNHYSNSQSFSMIREYAHVPVFRMMQSGIGQGLLGGYIVSYEEEGAIAGRMALRILNGADPQSIEVVTESPNYYYYDYQIMKKYNIKSAALPSDAILINEDVSILKKNAGIIIPTLMYIIGGIILIGFTGLLSNLRERNKLIRKVNNKNSELLLAVERAEKATMQAKKASNAKTDFLSRMSHDIRTPMNAIIGLTEITKMSVDNPDIVKSNLIKIDHSSQYLLDLINDILAMSRIESGKETLKIETFDMNEILSSISDIIHSQALIQDINFALKKDCSVRQYYMGDANKIKQIIMNLLSNALKFTNPKDSIELSIREKYESEENAALEIIVSDTGIGIEQEFISRMFEPFEQADKDFARNQSGSGLGLSIVKHFTEMMNGSINVTSEEGVGTQFTILISLKKCKEDVDTELELETVDLVWTEAHNKDSGTVSFEGVTILLAEDNEINLEIAQTILEMKGFVVDTVRNGQEAVDQFMKMPEEYYKCILMDIRMPVMSGIEATRKIRTSDKEYARKIPIVALTANAFQEDIEATRKAGMNAHLSKPIQPEVMFEALKNIIG